MRHFLRLFLVFLLCFVSETSFSQGVSQWQDIYKVQKKDTQYGIANKYGITIDELKDANPEMKDPNYVLKKGSKIYIPYHQQPVVEMKKLHTIPGQTIHVGVLLPLHDIDGDGKRMVEYYRGILMACDSLRNSGISTEIHAFNVPNESDIRVKLIDTGMEKMDIIFGPLYTKQVANLADFCRNNEIKMVIPFSISANDVLTNPYVYQVYQNSQVQADKSVDIFMQRFPDVNPVIIDCNDSTSTKGMFTSGLRFRLEQNGINYQITNLKSSLENFQKAFSPNKRNVVILNTGRSPELNQAFRKLNELMAANPTLLISMYGYNDWLTYERTYKDLFHKYDVYVPAAFYYCSTNSRTVALENNYKKWFKTETQQKYIPRFAITGYDQAQFFIRGLYQLGSDFYGSSNQSSYQPLQTPLRFVHATIDGGFQNTAFQLVHYRADKLVETTAY